MTDAAVSLENVNSAELEAARKEAARRGLRLDAAGPDEMARRGRELGKSLDVVYWLSHYGKTYDPRLPNPYVPFEPYERQIEYLRWLEELEREQRRLSSNGATGLVRACVEKSRDVGVSWLTCAFMLHRWQFKKGFAGGLGSRKLEYVDSIGDPKCLFEKLRILLKNEPAWMQPSLFDWKKHSYECRLLNPELQASIVGEGGIEIGRGGRTSFYFVDEYNHLEHPELADAALRDNAGVLLYGGTPSGMSGIYEKRGRWPTFTFHWKDDPRKSFWEVRGPDGRIAQSGRGKDAPANATYPWYEQQIEAHKDAPWIVKQEIDIDYLGSGHPRFDREFLASLRGNLKPAILEETPGVSSWSATVKTWKHAERNRRYLIVSDVAEGESNPSGDPDFSVSHVYDVADWEQVCTYRGRPDTHAYAVDLAVLGEMYNWADLAIERTGPGLSTIKTLTDEIGYPSVWSEAMSGDRSIAGIRATAKSKVESESELAGIIADMRDGFPGIVWNDPNTIDELVHFMVKPNGRAEAESSWHDDETTCCKIAAVLLPLISARRRETPVTPPKPRNFYGTKTLRGRW